MPRKPITTYKRFFKLLRISVQKHDYPMQLSSYGQKIPSHDKKGVEVYAHSIDYWRGGPIYSPFHVVWFDWFEPEYMQLRLSLTPTDVGRLIGLPQEKSMELQIAVSERPGHNPALRRRLLKACHLIEIPHKKRDGPLYRMPSPPRKDKKT